MSSRLWDQYQDLSPNTSDILFSSNIEVGRDPSNFFLVALLEVTGLKLISGYPLP